MSEPYHKVVKPFIWNLHADSTTGYYEWERLLNVILMEKHCDYFNEPLVVAQRNPELPPAFASSITGSLDTGTNRKDYNDELRHYEAKLKTITDLRLLHERAGQNACSALANLFDVNCLARKQVDKLIGQRLANNQSYAELYVTLMTLIETNYRPNKASDHAAWIVVLQQPVSKGNRGFFQYESNWDEAVEALTSMHMLPAESTLLDYLYVGTKDIPHVSEMILAMAKAIKQDLLPNAVQPIVPRWKQFLTAVHERMDFFPTEEAGLVMPKVSANSNTPYDKKRKGEQPLSYKSQAQAPYCEHCGRLNHKAADCRAHSNGGHCLCGDRIEKGQSCPRVANNYHKGLRERNKPNLSATGRGPSDNKKSRPSTDAKDGHNKHDLLAKTQAEQAGLITSVMHANRVLLKELQEQLDIKLTHTINAYSVTSVEEEEMPALEESDDESRDSMPYLFAPEDPEDILFDTGATTSLITRNTASEYGYPTEASIPVTIVSYNGVNIGSRTRVNLGETDGTKAYVIEDLYKSVFSPIALIEEGSYLYLSSTGGAMRNQNNTNTIAIRLYNGRFSVSLADVQAYNILPLQEYQIAEGACQRDSEDEEDHEAEGAVQALEGSQQELHRCHMNTAVQQDSSEQDEEHSYDRMEPTDEEEFELLHRRMGHPHWHQLVKALQGDYKSWTGCEIYLDEVLELGQEQEMSCASCNSFAQLYGHPHVKQPAISECTGGNYEHGIGNLAGTVIQMAISDHITPAAADGSQFFYYFRDTCTHHEMCIPAKVITKETILQAITRWCVGTRSIVQS
jgi:hypothetical protein